jgi:TPR repeat protein
MKTRPSSLLWVTGFAASLLCVLPGFPQEQLPDLAQVKAAAEGGDAEAQAKLGDSYEGRFAYAAAAGWFRKAAEQGVAHAQWRLGKMLLDGRRAFGESTVVVPKAADEGLKWIFLAANQGLDSAQLDLGFFYENGYGVKQNRVEAYKWYKLGSHKHEALESMRLNPLILKMSHEQIQEGERRAKDFTPHRTTKGELPDPQYVRDIVLKGISGSPNARFALINNQTLGKGETGNVKAGQKTVTVKCLEIKEKSVIVQIEGIEQPREIGLK